MAIDGKIGSIDYDDENARAGELIIILIAAVLAAQGVLPVGLILTRNADGKFIPYEEVDDEVLGTGDGATKDFTDTLAKIPAEPGSVVVTDGVETFSDDGFGRLKGDAGGSGTVNYADGAIAVSFNANVVNAVDVDVDYVTAIGGVLDETVDTTKTTSANYIRWGLARRDVLKVGAVAKAAPDAALLKRLDKRGIFAAG